MVGPLQVQVAEPDFIDWQNIDWSALSNQDQLLEDAEGAFLGADGGLFDFGSGYVSFISGDPCVDDSMVLMCADARSP